MRKVSKADLPRVQEEIQKKAADNPDLKLIRSELEELRKYRPILDELSQVKKVVEQRQAQQQPCDPRAPKQAAATEPGSLPPGVSTLIEFIRPLLSQYLTPKDPMSDLIMESMRKSITLQDTITQAVINRLLPPAVGAAPAGGTAVT